MKLKNVLIAAIIIAASTATYAQSIQGDFENWDSVDTDIFRNHLPDGWMDLSNRACEQEGKPWAVTRTTDAHSGSYAVLLKNISLSFDEPAMLMSSSNNENIMNNKIPVTARHTRFEGYYKYETPERDTFEITVLMVKGEEYLGYGEFRQSNTTPNYLKFSVPIVYIAAASKIPDSAVIMIRAGSSEHFVAGSALTLDDLGFNLSQGLNNEPRLDAEVNIWPNPAADETTLSLKGNINGNVKIEVIDLLGKTIKDIVIEPAGRELQTSVSLAGLPQGILFIKVSDNNGSKGFRILHQ
jgi:hypothetical protein